MLNAPKDVHTLISAYEHYGQELPEALQEPELHDVEYFYWNAFWLLHTERQVGMELWYIPHSKITEYHSKEGVSEDRAVFVDIIRTMDSIYMSKTKERGENG